MTTASIAWSWRHAVASSDLPAMTKHVLHTLGMFMNELGEGCYPSVADICRYSSLDKKTVLKHLGVARAAGWIAVSQHGYRGQKWKRQEYAARWPERDLTAPCPPSDGGGAGEGGGAVPPPFEAEKAVEQVPEGGGTEGPKVVEQLHQDKTSPETTPDTSPVERERAGDGKEGKPDTAEPDEVGRSPENAKAVQRDFEKAWRDWPTSISDSRPEAWKAWLELSPDERGTAAAEAGRYVEACRAAGRKHVCSHGVYLREKRWTGLGPKPDEKPAALDAKAFGPLWQAARMKQLLAGVQRVPAGLTATQRALVEMGKADEAELQREQQARSGWPTVNAMHERAEFGRGVSAAPSLEPLAALMEPVPVGSERFEEWKLEHRLRGWPWLPETGRQPVVYFPAGGPAAGLAAFAAAVRGERSDSEGQATNEAAE